jgi:hypothetical protein
MGGGNDSTLPIHVTAAIRRRGQTDRTNLSQAEAAQKRIRHLRSGSELRALSYHTTATRCVPGTFGQSGKISAHLYGSDGLLRFHPEISGQTIRGLLLAKNFDETAAAEIESFLLPMLRLDPAERATAAEMLRNDWLNKV